MIRNQRNQVELIGFEIEFGEEDVEVEAGPDEEGDVEGKGSTGTPGIVGNRVFPLPH